MNSTSCKLSVWAESLSRLLSALHTGTASLELQITSFRSRRHVSANEMCVAQRNDAAAAGRQKPAEHSTREEKELECIF